MRTLIGDDLNTGLAVLALTPPVDWDVALQDCFS